MSPEYQVTRTGVQDECSGPEGTTENVGNHNHGLHAFMAHVIELWTTDSVL